MIYMFSFKHPEFIVDLVQDIRRINSLAVSAKKTGAIILGGGVVKHHISNANLMRNGVDYAVYVNTAQEFDGSDAGARPDESVSWGKIKLTATPVKARIITDLFYHSPNLYSLLIKSIGFGVVDLRRGNLGVPAARCHDLRRKFRAQDPQEARRQLRLRLS
jgi:deoxyhypusine synthase